jgi:hypothetical protein
MRVSDLPTATQWIPGEVRKIRRHQEEDRRAEGGAWEWRAEERAEGGDT